jgi:hypothetical protein
MLVHRVVVADQVDFFGLRNGVIDPAQKSQPLLMTVALLA